MRRFVAGGGERPEPDSTMIGLCSSLLLSAWSCTNALGSKR